jgi:hypothetical protein
MTWILPKGIREPYAGLERWGLILVVFAVLFVQPVKAFVGDAQRAMRHTIEAAVSLGGTW